MSVYDLSRFEALYETGPDRPNVTGKAPSEWLAARRSSQPASKEEAGIPAVSGKKAAEEGPRIPFYFAECQFQPRTRTQKQQAQFVVNAGEDMACFTR
mmetsp:Transcript_13827/g.28723  ORF Transcript_13827/g.28723 Transcript_13827/m.28723 type:complete len:98 (+) Transcript_13827:66-359(+)